VFYLSDQTGITAELLGQTLLSQFDSVDFITQTIPYISTQIKAQKAVDLINRNAQQTGTLPVLISTIVSSEIKAILHTSEALMLDVFEHFIAPLEETFNEHSNLRVGKNIPWKIKKLTIVELKRLILLSIQMMDCHTNNILKQILF